VPAGFVGASLSFVSSDYGWVLGTAPCKHAPCTSLLRTTIGGRSWVGIPAPRASLSGVATDGVTSIRFANTDDGFAFDPGLWTTTNGGKNWTQTRTLGGMKRFTVVSLAATSNGTVYAVAERGSPESEGATGSMMLLRAGPHRTTFSSIRRISLPAGQPSVVSAGASAYVASGKDLLSFGPVGEHTVKLPGRITASTSCHLAASGATALIAVCGSSVAAGGMGVRDVFGTTDGGTHWTRLPNPGAGDGWETDAVAETTNGHAVIATSNAGRAGLLTTVDDAQTWRTTLSFNNANGPSLTDLGFENNLDGSVIYNGVINGLSHTPRPAGVLYRTSDGGVSWHRVAY
jgi:photosystem II stability/assembly factor-like uncharacterized protein